MRSEDNLATLLQQLEDVRSRASPLQQLEDVRSGDQPYTARGLDPPGGKDVAVDLVKGTVDSTGGCAPLTDLQHSLGH